MFRTLLVIERPRVGWAGYINPSSAQASHTIPVRELKRGLESLGRKSLVRPRIKEREREQSGCSFSLVDLEQSELHSFERGLERSRRKGKG